jgi:hypothetical protein
MRRLFLIVILATAMPACFGAMAPSYRVLSAQQLTEMGTRQYPNERLPHVVKSCAAALATLGFTVTFVDAGATQGVVKTAPLRIMTSAAGGYGQANIIEDSMSWDISVVSDALSNVFVHAKVRGFRNGSEMQGDVLVAEVMEPKFRDLWREIDSTVQSKSMQ